MKLALAATVLLLALPAGASAKTWLGGCTPGEKASYKPDEIILACGDAGLVLADIEWTKWDRSGADGTGTALSKTCKPNCAEGKTKRYPVEIRLGKRRACKHRPKAQFRALDVTFTKSHPSGLARNERFKRFCGSR